ncbi:hypothetical protein MMPV_001556 [Pyropia vietnamensis]
MASSPPAFLGVCSLAASAIGGSRRQAWCPVVAVGYPPASVAVAVGDPRAWRPRCAIYPTIRMASELPAAGTTPSPTNPDDDAPRSPIDDDPEVQRAREKVARYLESRSLSSLSDESNLCAVVFGSDITRWTSGVVGPDAPTTLLSSTGRPLGLPSSPLQLVWVAWETLSRALGARDDPTAPLYVLGLGGGVYTLDVDNRSVMLAFESRETAGEYMDTVAAMMGTRDKTLVPASVERLRGTCADEGRFLGVVPWATKVKPPSTEVELP